MNATLYSTVHAVYTIYTPTRLFSPSMASKFNNKRRRQACRYPAWASKGNPRWPLQKVWISKATSAFISLWSDDNLYLAPFKSVLHSEMDGIWWHWGPHTPMFLAVSPACRAVSEMFDVSHSEFEEKDTSSCLQAQHLLIPVRIRTSRATVAIRAED